MSQADVGAALAALEAHRVEVGRSTMRELFAKDSRRFERYQVQIDGLLFDYSKHRRSTTIPHLVELARAAGLEGKRAAMFAGEKVNITEHRAALHMALRNLSGRPVMVDGRDVMADVLSSAARSRTSRAPFGPATCAARPASRSRTSSTSASAVRISAPRWRRARCRPSCRPGLRAHFVSNVDGADLGDTLTRTRSGDARSSSSPRRPSHAGDDDQRRARRAPGSSAALGEAAVGDHFAAVSTKLDSSRSSASGRIACSASGTGSAAAIPSGRRSAWRSPSPSARQQFEEFLRGGHDIDGHFREAPLEKNIPVLMGLLGVWYRNVWGLATQAVIPYDQRLGRFPAYLQQLEMESNGKSRAPRRHAGRVRDRPGRLGRAGHQRPARVLPAAASGHRCRAGRFPGRRRAD